MDHIEVKKDKWNEEYINGEWDYLSQPDEAARYSIIVGYIRRYAHKGAILDLGCGAGELWNWLTEDEKKRYLGIDISEEAISLAKRKDTKCFFEGDIETFEFRQKYDLIVLNEVLYYIANPLSIIAKCFQNLAENGMIVISMFLYPDKRDGEYKIVEGILRQIKANREYYISDIVTLTNNYKWKRTWKILTLSRRNEESRKIVVKEQLESYFRNCKVEADEIRSIEGEEFFLKLNSGEYLYCLFFQNKTSRGTIIISHGYIKDIPYLKNFKLFYELGFSVFIYDMKGFGKSYGEETTYGFYECFDLSECIDWVKKRCGEKEIIGLYGDKIGAVTSIMNMRINNRANFGVMEDVIFDLKRYLISPHNIYTNIQWLFKNIRNRYRNGFWYGQISIIKELGKIERPVLLLDSTSDDRGKIIRDFINEIC